jgi:hypothetical protein
MPNTRKTTGGDRDSLLRHLRELVEALDRRVPHIERQGEVGIARDAEALRRRALERLTELKK